jgi:glyoxylase I family protein
LFVLAESEIHHVAIICSNYERSRAFYTETLGFAVLEETFRAERNSYKLDLRVGRHAQIELFSFPSPPPRVSRPEACGLRHLAFQVEDVEETHRRLSEKGVAVEEIRIDEITDKKFFFFADPDGLPLEVYQR